MRYFIYTTPKSFITWTNCVSSCNDWFESSDGIKFKHPEDWKVVVLGQEGGSYIDLDIFDTKSKDMLKLQVHGHWLDPKIIPSVRKFSFNDSQISEIGFTSEHRDIRGSCDYSGHGKEALDICNQILASLKIYQ